MPSMSAGTKRSPDDSTFKVPFIPELLKSYSSYSTRQSISLFISVVKKLTPEQIRLIHEVGFGYLLELKCSFTPKSLVCWIVNNFDSNSKAIVFSNGYRFKLDPSVVHKVLGLPLGGKKIDSKPTKETYSTIKNDCRCLSDSPTVSELVNIITPDLTGDSFVRVFLLFALSTLLCPTTHRHASSRYFAPLVKVDEIASYDWSLFTFDWLVAYVKRYQDKVSNGKSPALGGCTFFLVICYLEFLKSNDIVIPRNSPRLSYWTSARVSSLANCDLQPGSSSNFGRMPVKDISLTPFSDNPSSYCKLASTTTTELNVDTSAFGMRATTRRKLGDISDKLYSAIFDAIRPAIDSYVSEYIKIVTEDASLESNESFAIPGTNKLDDVDILTESISESDDDDYHSSSASKSNDCWSVLVFKEPLLHDVYHDHFSELVSKLDPISLENCPSEFDFSHCPANYDKLLSSVFPEITGYDIPTVDSDNSLSTYEIVSLCTDKDNVSAGFSNQEIRLDKFYLDESKIVNTCKFSEESTYRSNIGFSQGKSLNEHLFHCFPKCKQTYIGSADNIVDPSPSFDLITAACCSQSSDHREDNSPVPNNDGNISNTTFGFSTIGPSLAACYEQCAVQAELEYQEKLAQGLSIGFRKCSELINQEQLTHGQYSLNATSSESQAIFATEAEIIFYNKFTTDIPPNGLSQHIFQIDDVWIDKRTLALSMRSGCWFNSFAMFAFCKMFNCKQEERLKFRDLYPGEFGYFYMNKQLSELLMTNSLLHNDFRATFTQHRLGVKLDNVDHVFVPCVLDHQWFAVVANFIHKRFDVLCSNPAAGDYQQLVNTVVYNFKCLFILALPQCVRFNIRDFEPCYVFVPKQKFRYDSGIFTLSFMQTYNGNGVQNISNDDLLPLRQKFLFQLLSYSHNRFSRKFIDMIL